MNWSIILFEISISPQPMNVMLLIARFSMDSRQILAYALEHVIIAPSDIITSSMIFDTLRGLSR